jgi:hypothetical protein
MNDVLYLCDQAGGRSRLHHSLLVAGPGVAAVAHPGAAARTEVTSTAQHSTAQPSIAQHSTTQHNTRL